MSLPDHLLDPPDEEYCEDHQIWHAGRCAWCRVDHLDDLAEWAREREAMQ